MSKVYTLPAEYGSVAPARLHDGDPIILIAREQLTPVVPPLPTKPGIYTDKDGDPWRLTEEGRWRLGGVDMVPPTSLAPFTRLIPTPEPVALPFERNGVRVERTKPDGDRVFLSTRECRNGPFAHLTDADALTVAAALQTAATR